MKAKAQNDLFSPEFHLPRENSEGKQIIKIEMVFSRTQKKMLKVSIKEKGI